MTDTLSREARSRNMSAIRGRNTGPERLVRTALKRLRVKFRAQQESLPGTPDFFLPQHSVALFVHGCFWHHHHNCRNATIPATRKLFWTAKFESNRRRHNRVAAALRREGYSVYVLWECQLSSVEEAMRLLRRRGV